MRIQQFFTEQGTDHTKVACSPKDNVSFWKMPVNLEEFLTPGEGREEEEEDDRGDTLRFSLLTIHFSPKLAKD